MLHMIYLGFALIGWFPRPEHKTLVLYLLSCSRPRFWPKWSEHIHVRWVMPFCSFGFFLCEKKPKPWGKVYKFTNSSTVSDQSKTYVIKMLLSCCLHLLRRTSVCAWRCQVHHHPRVKLSAAVGCFRGFEVKPCHSAAPRHRGLVKDKLVIHLWRHCCTQTLRLTDSYTHTHTQPDWQNRRYITINHDMALVPQKSPSGERKK